MKVVRLPAIHHDANIIIVSGTLGAVLIDAGTAWYQGLQIERISGILDSIPLDHILLTSRRYPCAGGALHLSKHWGGIPIHIHSEGQSALETGDFFTTWANRYDSDMPQTPTLPLEDGQVFALGNGEIQALSLPGHAPDGMGFWMKEMKMLVAGTLLPRADRPARWDLPGGSLTSLKSSLERVRALQCKAIVPLQGPAIRGKQHVDDVLQRHIEFVDQCISLGGQPPSHWNRPSPTALWHTPMSPWPLEEREAVDELQ
jgi:glyoxylase-like metal-dependent hydrolase (beta-lactamase superfamily II)